MLNPRRDIRSVLVVALALAFVLTEQGSALAGTTWYSGQRTFAEITVEPAVNLANGNEVFLLTPNKAPLPSKAADVATAPLYLPLYPASSTIPADTLNCTPTNCDHVQSFIYPLKGHDHLVGVAPTGDFNVAWDVILIVFTQQGFADGAINTRILTQSQLDAALAAGDVVEVGPVLTFNCSITSIRTYLQGTPLAF